MAKLTNTSAEAFKANPALLAEIRFEVQNSATDLLTNVLRLNSGDEQTIGARAISRENAWFIVNVSNYDIDRIVNHTADVNTALFQIKSLAETFIEHYYKNLKISRNMPNRELAAERIIKTVESLKKNFALIHYYYEENRHKRPIKVPTIPNQQPAPIRVEINENHLDLTASQTVVGSITPASIENLRLATQELLGRTLDQIGSNSNIDPRLAPNLAGLNKYLFYNMAEMPVEALGLNYQFARRSFISVKDTVPDPIAEQIDQILSTVNVILTQFEEWRVYTSAETALTLTPDSMHSVVRVSQEIENFFEGNVNLVEPKLIDRLKEITDAYSQGLVNLESAAVPLIESLGNIFSELSRFIISQSPATVGSVGPSGAVILFLGFAIRSIETFTPTLSGFPPLSYLIDVQKFAHKQFSLLKDSLPSIS